MQGATRESVAAVKEIGGTIEQLSAIASVIESAVQRQSHSTQEIACSVKDAASGAEETAGHISQVNRGATDTGAASAQVLNLAQMLAAESCRLQQELDIFHGKRSRGLSSIRGGERRSSTTRPDLRGQSSGRPEPSPARNDGMDIPRKPSNSWKSSRSERPQGCHLQDRP
jgi:hypothetical protein